MRLSAAFTALAGLVRKPKGQQKGAKPWGRLLCCTPKQRAKRRARGKQQQQPGAAAAAADPAGAANGAGSSGEPAAAAAAGLGREQQRRAAEAAALGAAADGEAALAGPAASVEDPFAGLNTAPSGALVSCSGAGWVVQRRGRRCAGFCASSATALSPLAHSALLHLQAWAWRRSSRWWA